MGFLNPSMHVQVKKSSITTYRFNSAVGFLKKTRGFLDGLEGGFRKPEGEPNGVFLSNAAYLD